MKRIGWLADTPPDYVGGAELASEELIAAAPEWAEIVRCAPPDRIDPNVDAYVLHNVTSYDPQIVRVLERRPVVKQVHDVWPHGDPGLRQWILDNAALLFFSAPLHVDTFPHRVRAPIELIPNPLNLERFRDAARDAIDPEGAVWVGRIFPGKGIAAALKWASDAGVALDVYGFGPEAWIAEKAGCLRRKLPYDEVPRILASYETFVMLPDAIEPFSRTVVEAWAAGCELIVNGNVGALWWIQTRPEDLDRGVSLFWSHVAKVVGVTANGAKYDGVVDPGGAQSHDGGAVRV